MADRYEGFEAFIATRGAALMRTASLLTGDRAAAEAALQETLTRVATRWPNVVRSGAVEPQVRRVLYAVVIRGWRRQHLIDVEPGNGAARLERSDGALSAPNPLAISAALGRLTPRQRALLVLRYYDDLTEVQAADALSCSAGAVVGQTEHALGSLRALLPDPVGSFIVDDAADDVGADDGTDGPSGAGITEVLS